MSAVGTENEIEELLPFWVNGTLSADEAARVERAVSENELLAADAEWLRQLRAQVRKADAPASPGAFGQARLMRAVDTLEAAKPTPNRWVPAAWGALAASVVTAALFFSFGGSDAPVFEQASGDGPAAGVSVMFQPGLSSDTLSAFLLDAGLVIVDGPSALGIYQLAPIEDRDLSGLAEMLQGRSDVFEFVETFE